MNYKYVLALQSFLVFITFLLLTFSPGLIPSQFGIKGYTANMYVLGYTIAASELALAYLAFSAFSFTDLKVLKIVARFFIIFHATVGLYCIYGCRIGIFSAAILPNIVLRVFAVWLHSYYGFLKNFKMN